MTNDFVVREATAEDKEAVLEFDKDIWGGRDYIPSVWDEWLQDKDGKLLVCTHEEKPIGIGHVHLQNDRTAWLEGGRVDPDFRRRGVGTLVAESCIDYARRQGREQARLATSRRNKAAFNLNLKLGFEVVTEYAVMKKEASEPTTAVKSRTATGDERDDLWWHLQDSDVFERAAGMYTRMWEWYDLTPEALDGFLKDGRAIVYRPGDAMEGAMLVAEAEFRERETQTCYIDATEDAVHHLASWLEEWTIDIGATNTNVFAVNYEPMVSVLSSLGFEKRLGHIVVFEKKLENHSH